MSRKVLAYTLVLDIIPGNILQNPGLIIAAATTESIRQSYVIFYYERRWTSPMSWKILLISAFVSFVYLHVLVDP